MTAIYRQLVISDYGAEPAFNSHEHSVTNSRRVHRPARVGPIASPHFSRNLALDSRKRAAIVRPIHNLYRFLPTENLRQAILGKPTPGRSVIRYILY
jgi:hypothetical protein